MKILKEIFGEIFGSIFGQMIIGTIGLGMYFLPIEYSIFIILSGIIILIYIIFNKFQEDKERQNIIRKSKKINGKNK